MLANIPEGGAGIPSEELISVLVDLEDLQNELKSLQDDSESNGSVRVPLKPQPHLSSGAIALAEPDEPNL
jgi:hypothetical protein